MHNRLRELREAMGYVNDQAGFAERIGVNQSTISSWESGTTKPAGTRLKKLATVGINVEWLRTGRGEMFLDQSASSDEISEIIAVYRKLQPEQRALINSIAAQFLNNR